MKLTDKFSEVKFIAHRINNVSSLGKVPHHYGVELDLRDRGERLILAHDPFQDGEDFEDFLGHYRHALLILNVKSERVELRVLEQLKKFKIQDYLFLDSSFPMIVNLIGQGEKRVAIRYSEYEPLANLERMQGKVDYVWVDCFTQWPLNPANFKLIKQWGYKLLMVSPELQGRPQDVQNYAKLLLQDKMVPDYICSKLPQILEWEKLFEGK